MGAYAMLQRSVGQGQFPLVSRPTGPKQIPRYNLFNRSVQALKSGNITPDAKQKIGPPQCYLILANFRKSTPFSQRRSGPPAATRFHNSSFWS
jgi:hypothetical protein